MSIQILDEDVVSQIAAGEVVERPASVVKEMIENSLDAGADFVRVEVYGGGRRMIRVSDNGTGIPSHEVELAFARHATSKLRTITDLNAIRTLGFRGEALSSIASVSQLNITTRFEGEDMGITLRLEGGHIQQQRPIGSPKGTVIEVENLFYNTPARLKFLKKEATEKRHIASLVTRYGLAYPDVRFVLEQDGREVFHSTGSGELADVLLTAHGLDDFKNMFEVRTDSDSRIQVYGYTSSPSLNRADRGRIALFVNGRWIQDTSLTYAVIQAYHTLLMTGRYPIAVLMIDLPPNELDVNVHPTKAEVRFQNPDEVFSVVQRAVRRAVIDQSQTPALRHRHFNDMPDLSERALVGWRPEQESAHQLSAGLQLDSPGDFTRQRFSTDADDHGDYDEDDPTSIPDGMGTPQKPRTLPLLRVVGQVGASYIIAEGPAGMYLIDQHAAHERILYEQFMAEYDEQEHMSQYTLAAQTLQLSAPEARLIEENSDTLRVFGFTLEPFGPNTFVIRSIPAMLADSEPLEIMTRIIEDLEQEKDPGQDAIEAKIVLRVCKQAAVKAGQVLSHDEMQGLIRQLERTDSPLTCPHGRPTMIYMSGDQLAREFGRT